MTDGATGREAERDKLAALLGEMYRTSVSEDWRCSDEADWLLAHGVTCRPALPTEPSEAAIDAALEHTIGAAVAWASCYMRGDSGFCLTVTEDGNHGVWPIGCEENVLAMGIGDTLDEALCAAHAAYHKETATVCDCESRDEDGDGLAVDAWGFNRVAAERAQEQGT